MHKHLRRLERIWIDAPIYFVTTCTRNRRSLLVRDEVAAVLINEWRAAHDRHGWAVGRYVIMPDHVHFFCRPELDAKSLSEFVGFLEELHEPEDSMCPEGRGQRPRLQRCGNVDSLITFCAQAKVILKSGTTSGTTLSEPGWSLMQNGITLVRLRH
jgi:hypothetical protein